jgi:hypothetical protein
MDNNKVHFLPGMAELGMGSEVKIKIAANEIPQSKLFDICWNIAFALRSPSAG